MSSIACLFLPAAAAVYPTDVSCSCVTEPWAAFTPSENCSANVQRQCLADYPGRSCPYRVPLTGANTTGLVAWLEATAADCSDALPIFTTSTFDSARSLNLASKDVESFALSLFLNAAWHDVPAASYSAAYDASVNGSSFLLLSHAELIDDLSLSEEEADTALSWRFNLTSACTCVTTEAWPSTTDYFLPGPNCVAGLDAACVIARAQGADCEYGAFLRNNTPYPLGSVLYASGRALAPIIIELATYCPGGKEYLGTANTASELGDQLANELYAPWQQDARLAATIMYVQPLLYGMPISFEDEPYLAADRFYENGIGGTQWVELSQGTVQDLGESPLNLPYKTAISFKNTQIFIDNFNLKPPRPEPGQTVTDVSIDLQLDRLVDVTPPSAFAAEFTVTLSWYDARITRTCPYFYETEEPQDEACKYFWRPKFTWPTALGNDDAPLYLNPTAYAYFAGEQGAKITDILTGLPLTLKKAAESAGLSVPGLNRSTGAAFFQLRANFYSTLNYELFPFDKQDLNITFELADANPALTNYETICLSSHAVAKVPPEFKHPVWSVIGVEPTVAVSDRFQAEFASNTPIDVAFNTGDPERSSTYQEAQAYLRTKGFFLNTGRLCRATFIVHVRRITTSYIVNYIMFPATNRTRDVPSTQPVLLQNATSFVPPSLPAASRFFWYCSASPFSSSRPRIPTRASRSR